MKPLPGYNVEVVKPQDAPLVSVQVPAFAGAIPEIYASTERVNKNKPVEHFGVMVPVDQRDIIPIDAPIRTKTIKKKRVFKKTGPKPVLSAHGVCREFFRAIKKTRPEFKMVAKYSDYDKSEAARLLDELKEGEALNEPVLMALIAWHIRQKLQGHKPLDYNAGLRALRESWPKFKPLAPRPERLDEAGEKAFNRPVVNQEVSGIGEDIKKALNRSDGLLSALTIYGVVCTGHCLLSKHESPAAVTFISEALKNLPQSNLRAIYRRTVEYGIPKNSPHAFANWREIFKEHWVKAGCADPANFVSQEPVVVEFVSTAV